VVAGHAAAVARLMELASAQKARVQALEVSAPFHCPLMAPAAEGLARHLSAVSFRDPSLPVFTSVEARRVRGAADAHDLLVRQVTAPVRWEDTMRAVAGTGAELALEVGPGRVLCGLLRRIVPGLRGMGTGDVDGIRKAREALAA
jgi:[acyl-carrier-protein] S-malonyltransferase